MSAGKGTFRAGCITLQLDVAIKHNNADETNVEAYAAHIYSTNFIGNLWQSMNLSISYIRF